MKRKSDFNDIQQLKKQCLTNISENHTNIAFQKASIEYYNDLGREVAQALSKVFITQTHVQISPDDSLFYKIYDVDGNKFMFHELHYGELKGGIDWIINRDLNSYTNKGLIHPFKLMQIDLAIDGYYLQDIGDTTFKLIIGPHLIKPYYYDNPIMNYASNEETLWHGLDLIPKLGQ